MGKFSFSSSYFPKIGRLMQALGVAWAIGGANAQTPSADPIALAQSVTPILTSSVTPSAFSHSVAHSESQRQNFLAAEATLQAAISQNRLSPALLQAVEKLQDPAYPLQPEWEWLRLSAKMALFSNGGENTENSPDLAALMAQIAQFSQRYPELAKRHAVSQKLFASLYQQQKLGELIAYAERYSPQTLANHCRLFSAKFQQLAEQLALNPEAVQASQSAPSPEMAVLLAEFETFWLNSPAIEPAYWQTQAALPSECNGIAAYWRDQGGQTAAQIQQQAVGLFQQNAKEALALWAKQATDEPLKAWLAAVSQLLADRGSLAHFAENQPLDRWNKILVQQAFSTFVRTLPEQLPAPSFAPYQGWAEKFQLTEAEIHGWKVSFLNRLFDHADPIFQLWRDEQIQQLKQDSLTERRLRLAILQQADLSPWLALLSAEARAKAEWRYWAAKGQWAKNDPAGKAALAALAQEWGFYPMLAAHWLNQPYQLHFPPLAPLSEEHLAPFQPALARIAELRALDRHSAAKLAWNELLQAVSFNEKLTLSQYAQRQQWFDLAVEATIVAKAWDYLPLRLPNAYADWFALHLADKPITPSFAMAIARQESAWNPAARSHANAMGLMQLLPSTAKATAQRAKLPYQNEQALFSPFTNIMIGTAHLAELAEKYPNNRVLIAAAYNAGASRVEKWLARANGKLAIDEFIATIPFLETRGYVQNVLAYDVYHQQLYPQNDLPKDPQNSPQKQPLAQDKRLFSAEELRLY